MVTKSGSDWFRLAAASNARTFKVGISSDIVIFINAEHRMGFICFWGLSDGLAYHGINEPFGLPHGGFIDSLVLPSTVKHGLTDFTPTSFGIDDLLDFIPTRFNDTVLGMASVNHISCDGSAG